MKNYILVFLLFITFSCKDFLEPKSDSEYIPKEASALNEMLIGDAYPTLSSTGLYDFLFMLDDDLQCTDSAGILDGTITTKINGLKSLYSWQPDVHLTLRDNGFSTDSYPWKNHYKHILGANAVMDYIDDVSGTTDEKSIVKAQALALRAFFYFTLVNIYAEPYNHNKQALGVPLKLTSAMETLELSRNTVEEVYEQILKDLDEAEILYESLPKSEQFRKNYRTNLPMVQLLKSRVYLFMENWSKSAEYAQKVIEDWELSLLDLNNINSNSYYNYYTYESGEGIWMYGSIRDVISYTISDVNVLDGNKYRNLFLASNDLLDKYIDGDLRKEKYIIKNYNNQEDYMPAAKVRVNATHSFETTSNFGFAFRLPEAFLNLAEASAMNNDPTTALRVINNLRKTRFSNEKFIELSGLTDNDLLEAIRLERRLELCYEGHRWFDLKRYGMPSFRRIWKINKQNIEIFELEKNDPFYAVPIPISALESNRNLIQNKLPDKRESL